MEVGLDPVELEWLVAGAHVFGAYLQALPRVKLEIAWERLSVSSLGLLLLQAL